MRVGIIADTHDRLPFIEKAVQRLNQEKIELVLHAGDYSAPFVIPRFKPLKTKMRGVLGNNDAMNESLRVGFDQLGHEVHGRFAEVRVEEMKIGLLHGDETALLESLVKAESHDVIVYGHTHQTDVRRRGKTLVVNPGEVCGYLSGWSTIALLETTTLEAEIITLG